MSELERLRAMVLHPDWNEVVRGIASYRRENAHKIAIAELDHPVDRAFLDRRIDSINWGKRHNHRVSHNIERWDWNADGNSFNRFPLITVRELIAINEYKMLQCPNVGPRTVERIKSKLAEHGLYLGMTI